jgi:hypothetical protein
MCAAGNRLENGPPVGYPLLFPAFQPDTSKFLPIADQRAGILRIRTFTA